MIPSDYITFRDSIHISQYDSTRRVLHNGQGKYFLINDKTQKLITILKNSKNWQEAYGQFVENEREDLSPDDFIKLIYSVLKIKSEEDTPSRKSYLRLRLTIIKKDIAGLLGDAFTFLFHKEVFFYVFFLLGIVNVAFAFFLTDSVSLPHNDWTYFLVILIYFFSVVLHEVGHISACRNFGSRHGGIGVGFYFVFPVSWADVTGLWMLPRKERVITNLAGIHIQFFMNLFVIAAYLITGMPFLLLTAELIVFSSLFQLWPFMRYDGYWILSDSLETPNLMSVSASKVKNLFLELIGTKEKRVKNRKDWYLIIYAFSNTFLTILYILFIVVKHSEIVIHYPAVTWKLIMDLINGQFAGSELIVNYLMVTLFYYILIKKSYEWINMYTGLRGFRLFNLDSTKV